jgi:hypothetical protein
MRRVLVLVLAGASVSCAARAGSESGPARPAEVAEVVESSGPAAPPPPEPPPPEVDAGAPAAPPSPVERDAARAAAIEATYHAVHPAGRDDLGWYGLEAVAAVPAWASGSKAELARDDDLRTAWTCEQRGAKAPCALSLSFPQAAEVSLIRLFGSRGVTKQERLSFPRVKAIKVHTGGGWVRASLRDYWTHQYVLLSAPVSTSGLAIEVESVYAGKAGGSVGIAEVEVFGPSGVKRAPLELDPSRAFVRGSPDTWVYLADGDSAGCSVPGPQWVEELAADGNVRRILPGSALYGDPGDRWLLVPQFLRHDCGYDGTPNVIDGRYLVIDRERRAFTTVEGLGTLGGRVWRQEAGAGFAAAPHPSYRTCEAAPLDIAVLEAGAGELRTKQVSISCPDTCKTACYDARMKRLGYEPAQREDGLTSRCTKITFAEARRLVPAASLPFSISLEGCDEWRRCDVGDGLTLVLLSVTCESGWAGLLGPGGTLLASVRSRDGLLKARRLAGGPLLLETSAGLHRLEADHPLELALPSASFDEAVGPLCPCTSYEGDCSPEERTAPGP